jgi:hypothetical protein
VAGNVGKNDEGGGDHHGRHDGQTIQTVGQVHRIAGADNDEISQRDETDDPQRVGHRLEEGNDQLGLRPGLGRVSQKQRGAQTQHRLPEVFPAGRQTFRVAVDHFFPVVVPADDAKAQGNHQHGPHVLVAQITPQQGGDTDGDQDQDAAHGRRAGLHQVRLRTVGAHRLADLFLGQPANDPRAGGEGDQQAPSSSPARCAA